MARNTQFTSHPPDPALTLQRVHGPLPFLNPTSAHFSHSSPSALPDKPAAAAPNQSNVSFLWRSRDNRKGRHPLLVQKPHDSQPPLSVPRPTSHPAEIVKTLVKTLTCFPVWDISWLVAFIFTWGSVIWVINVCTEPRRASFMCNIWN